MGDGTKAAFRLMHPVFSRLYFWRHGIHNESRSRAPDIVKSGLDRIAEQVGRSGYLVGDGFSVADLAAAALLAPIVRPEGTIWAALGALPDAVQRFTEEASNHEAFAWVHEMYRRHRGGSAEITS